jgi:hypothetical protein
VRSHEPNAIRTNVAGSPIVHRREVICISRVVSPRTARTHLRPSVFRGARSEIRNPDGSVVFTAEEIAVPTESG